jgi:hypothetical protein
MSKTPFDYHAATGLVQDWREIATRHQHAGFHATAARFNRLASQMQQIIENGSFPLQTPRTVDLRAPEQPKPRKKRGIYTCRTVNGA